MVILKTSPIKKHASHHMLPMSSMIFKKGSKADLGAAAAPAGFLETIPEEQDDVLTALPTPSADRLGARGVKDAKHGVGDQDAGNEVSWWRRLGRQLACWKGEEGGEEEELVVGAPTEVRKGVSLAGRSEEEIRAFFANGG
jgi:hypothetical protein